MKLFTSVVLTLVLAAAAAAQQAYTAYSVTNVTPANGTITATVSVSKGSKATIFADGTVISISTSSCSGTPKKGENGIVVNGPLGRSLLTSGGASCKISNILQN
jgi:hypothetical protein